MIKSLDEKHRKILEILKKYDNHTELSYRKIWEESWLHHQTVVNKIMQLEDMWYLRKNYNTNNFEILNNPVINISNIPIFWFALCWNKSELTVSEIPTWQIPCSTKLLWITNSDDYFFIEAKWDSMSPDINSWDYILIKKQSSFNDYSKFLVIHNWVPRIKKILKVWWSNYLLSTNTNHEDIKLISEDDVEIVWIVKKVIKNI